MPHETADGSRLDRAVDSITVGHRHRREVGDLETLQDSIARIGLLCPITVTPDGHLLCGWRRLEAVRGLGWKTVPVFVRRASAGLRDLIAEQDENTIREPLDLTAEEALYREYKSIEAEQAAQRQRATRFHASERNSTKASRKRDAAGSAESAVPRQQDEHPPGQHGDSRAKAAQMVTGRKSYTRLEHAGRIKDARQDPELPVHIRAMATAAWKEITAGHTSPEKEWKRISAAITEHAATNDELGTDDGQIDTADLAAVARAALAQPRPRRRVHEPSDDAEPVAAPATHRPLSKALTHLDSWIRAADPDALAEHATTIDLARLHHASESLDHLCTAIHAALHKRHPALRRRKAVGAQGDDVSDDRPRLW
ncbi:ParB N-terminal domain-containing protein [Myceligenerans crystallogenes]|uniref:ParB-like N-terminal domain-containing protein n=1 Tax=Myceligenerans crystallogenes TaxID=316335 RepID=A0ABN2NEB6_9MICO